MTINDLELNERCLKIRLLAKHLPKLMSDGQEDLLFKALRKIAEEAEDSQYRLNKIRWLATREPMGA